ncbi:CRISPR-associated endonuclease Cas2 [Bifidobacterium pseudocatenulatum]|uniref:CRISPR-associated endonuclease Cas2 n=1 Tax=Bifidobacterium pseudocatenulatum TaxID=28026 RepID=A0AAQ0LWK6_BIFPS|nr:CRISPR-associated endonuclease Cas2 [Bifidobacterium pseudocatenulatum]
MSDEKRSYLVAYDINDDRRRDHVAKILRCYGERLQYPNRSTSVGQLRCIVSW